MTDELMTPEASDPQIIDRDIDEIPAEAEGGPSENNGFVDPSVDDMYAYPTDLEPEEELSADEKAFKLEEAVTRHPLNREIMYRILGFCAEERLLRVIEEEVATWPEFAHCTQNQFHMIDTLRKNYGVELIERDAEGNVVTPAQKEGLTEDEIDDLVATLNYKTTEIGAAFYAQHAPRARILELMDARPERAATYREVLQFINEQPRTYNDMCALLEGREVLNVVINGNEVTMQPSVFVDKLERSGAIVWDKGWKLTKEGKEYLEELERTE